MGFGEGRFVLLTLRLILPAMKSICQWIRGCGTIEASFNPTLWWFFSAGSLVAVIGVVDGLAMPVVALSSYLYNVCNFKLGSLTLLIIPRCNRSPRLECCNIGGLYQKKVIAIVRLSRPPNVNHICT
jgi:hypothetical protein